MFGMLTSLLTVLIWAYVVGTLIWLVVVAPRMHKRQLEILRRLDAIERQMSSRD